jgi:hypothetical protein
MVSVRPTVANLGPDDARVLMMFNGGLSQAAEHLGIDITAPRLAEIEEMLEAEVSSIEAFPDALEVAHRSSSEATPDRRWPCY